MNQQNVSGYKSQTLYESNFFGKMYPKVVYRTKR